MMRLEEPLGAIGAYRMRLRRKRYQIRAARKSRELSAVKNRTKSIGARDVLVFATVRNERTRLPYFLEYYRRLGAGHFLIVDNDSDDDTREYLTRQKDVSLWHTRASYRRSRYGTDWVNWLKRRYAHGAWTLTVDPDEFFVYPFCDTRSMRALCDWLDASSIRSFGTLLLDMYPKGALDETAYLEGQDPFEIARWFDAGNYQISRNPDYGNLWIQGGPRARVFFRHAPEQAPALNKIPLVKWDRRYVHVSSTHMLLPRGLNTVFDEWGGEKASGCLLHAKFLDMFPEKSAEEVARKEHYSGAREYRAYEEHLAGGRSLWCQFSEKYINWRQLEVLGLMSKGNWA